MVHRAQQFRLRFFPGRCDPRVGGYQGLAWRRAAGWDLGDTIAEQAMGPFLNPLEMNMPDKKSVILKVQEADYADLFREVWGMDSLDAENDIDGTYERIARSIAAFERSFEVITIIGIFLMSSVP